MGAIKTTELSNGNIGLEITYGGKEAPFGGVDTSAPPAYIDPRCFTASDGFLVIDNKLVAVSLQLEAIPTLWNGVAGVILLDAGTFYNSTIGQVNYALGYTATPITQPASGVAYVFYMTEWNPSNLTLVNTDTLALTLFDAQPILETASLTLDLVATNTSQYPVGTGAVFSIATVDGTGAITAVTISNGGTLYNVRDQFNLYQGSGPGLTPGDNGVIQVTTVGAMGAITGIRIVNPWYGFTTGATSYQTFFSDTVTGLVIAPPVMGSGATLSITTVSPAGGILGMTALGGTNYQAGQAFKVVQGTNQSAWFYITSVDSSGGITHGAVQAPFLGFGYTTGTPTQGFGGFAVWMITGTSALTKEYVVTTLVAAINASATASALVTATASVDGSAVVLSAVTPGPVGNLISVEDTSANQNQSTAPPFYFPAFSPRFLEGGQLSQTTQAPRFFTTRASIAAVGGTLYIANLGPMILKYSGPGLFTISTLYNGVEVLRKFAGSLIGLGLIPQLGTFVQNEDMIFAWSASEDLDIWAPVGTDGNVTGAGFEELADIADYLSGLIVANGTAYILRSQGVSYATATGNGTLPFAVNHIGLGDRGEGAQVSDLVCQYDSIGAFVGNSNVYQISNSLSPIGDKIKALLYTAYSLTQPMSAGACSILVGGNEAVLFAFNIGTGLFLYNGSNQTWMFLSFAVEASLQLLSTFYGSFAFSSSGLFNQSSLVFVQQFKDIHNVPQTPFFYSLVDGLANSNAINGTSTVTFPVEEVAFGRDVTVDALYVALIASVSENVTITFSLNGSAFSTLLLTSAEFNSLSGKPIEKQLFPPSGPVTVHSPQLQYSISELSDTGTVKIRFTKLALFASYDPAQRPV